MYIMNKEEELLHVLTHAKYMSTRSKCTKIYTHTGIHKPFPLARIVHSQAFPTENKHKIPTQCAVSNRISSSPLYTFHLEQGIF